MSAEDEIRTLLATYERALNTADPELAVSCYTSDGMFMPQGSPTGVGAELRARYERVFEVKGYDITFTIDEIVVVDEDFAYAITHSRGTITILADGTRHAGANREMFLFRRVAGRWRIFRYLFNNDVLPPGA